MSKLRSGLGLGRPQRGAHGAFGCAAPRSRHEVDEDDAERQRIRDILAAEYSFEELQEISANMRREMERRQEIAEMFGELDGSSLLEDELFKVYKHRAGKQLERYHATKNDPRVRAKNSERALKRYHANRAECLAAHKTWLKRSRSQRTAAYLKMIERWRARYRDADEALRERFRKASRESQKRKRDRLKREDPTAYRALLDARNSKRAGRGGRKEKGRVAPRFGNEGRTRAGTAAYHRERKRRLRQDPVAYRAFRDRENEVRRRRIQERAP
jgi:hypothetical protein